MTSPSPRTARSHCIALDGVAPDWIELIPAGPILVGADGRTWRNDDPAALVAAFAARHVPLVVDWEHATETRAPQGLDAPAAGWIDRVEARDGAIWGHVEWTEKAAAQIAAREYRFLSPAFDYEKDSRRILRLASVGLTNTPNLTLTALNRAETAMPDDLLERLRYLLNLPTLATAEDIVAELDKLKSMVAAMPADTAANRPSLSVLLERAMNHSEHPSLERFVPRADYDAALARATNAEARLTALETAQRDAKVTALLEKALVASQIVPATQEYYRAMCRDEAGIAAFEAFLAKAPAVIGAPSGLDGKPAPGQSSGPTALTDAQRAICRAIAIPEADYAKHIKEAA